MDEELTVSRLAVRAETSYGTLRRFPPAVPISYSKLDSAVVVAFLFHDGIVAHDFIAAPSVLGNERVGARWERWSRIESGE